LVEEDLHVDPSSVEEVLVRASEAEDDEASEAEDGSEHDACVVEEEDSNNPEVLEEEGVDDAEEEDGLRGDVLQVVDDSRSEEGLDSFLLVLLSMLVTVPVAGLLRLGAVGASDHKANAEAAEAEEGTTWSTLQL
jgi:hypothetical protein